MSQIAPVMHREPVQIEKRRPLTRSETIQLTLDQRGRCGCGCGFKLDPIKERVIDEHLLPLILGGSNDITNRAIFRRPCAKDKTRIDAWRNAKANRQAAMDDEREPSRLQSRGFDRSVSRGLDGRVRPRRKSGERCD